MSKSLVGRLDERQLYDAVSINNSSTLLYRSGDLDPIEIDIDNININNSDKTLTVKFECNTYLAGQIIDTKFKKIDICFLDYVASREIANLKNSFISFPASDLCMMTLTFDFVDPI